MRNKNSISLVNDMALRKTKTKLAVIFFKLMEEHISSGYRNLILEAKAEQAKLLLGPSDLP